jgi:hypothetical protein
MLGCSDPEPIACDDAGWQRTKRSWGQGWAYPWLGVRMVVASPRAHPCLFLATFGWNLSGVTALITSCSSFSFTGYIVSSYTQFPVSEDSLTQGWLLFVGVVWPHSHGLFHGSGVSMTASTWTLCQPFAVPRSKISACWKSCRVVGLLVISFSAVVSTRGQLLKSRRWVRHGLPT